jgi:hypothetical protein
VVKGDDLYSIKHRSHFSIFPSIVIWPRAR